MNLLSHSPDEYMEYFIKSPIFADFTAEEIETFLKHNNYKIVKLDTNESLEVELGKSVYLISFRGRLQPMKLTRMVKKL